MPARPTSTLFLCRDNGAASLMAESLLRAVGGARFQTFSAGPRPAARAHAEVIQCLRERHMPLDDLRPKNWLLYAGDIAASLDYVIVLGDDLDLDEAPEWPGDPIVASWGLDGGGIEDVNAALADPRRAARACGDLFWMLLRRIKIFASLRHGELPRQRMEDRLYGVAIFQ